jgi:hypothetical protein
MVVTGTKRKDRSSASWLGFSVRRRHQRPRLARAGHALDCTYREGLVGPTGELEHPPLQADPKELIHPRWQVECDHVAGNVQQLDGASSSAAAR